MEKEKLTEAIENLQKFVKLAKSLKDSELLQYDTLTKAELQFVVYDVKVIIKRLTERRDEI